MHVRFRNKKNIDIKNNKTRQFFAPKKDEAESVLFSRGKKSVSFFTEDSKLYITPKQQELLRRGMRFDHSTKKWDSLSSRIVNDFVHYEPNQASKLLKLLEKRYAIFNEDAAHISRNFIGQFSLVRLWNLSMIGSILLGMVMMTFVYRYLGQGASADQISQVATQEQVSPAGEVLGAETSGDQEDAEAFTRRVLEIEQANDQKALENDITKMVKGYPIEKMVPFIAEKDRIVAAFIVGIARKESGWGVHVPVLNGQDCYNYWGYRGIRDLMGTGGHTCFNSPEDAVDTVAKRITTLVEEYGRNTPEKMVVWKCGSSCAATGGQAAADKWISDVTMYFDKLNAE